MTRDEPGLSALPEPDPLDGWERALLDRQLEALGRLADMGMDIAAAVTKRATADSADDVVLRNAPLDFARVSRAVRMAFALQSKLIADFKGAARAGPNDDDQGPVEVCWRDDIVDHDEVRKRQLKGVVERLAEAAQLEREVVERLSREAGERLEDDDIYLDLTRRSTGEIVALICQDLGLAPAWDRVADEWWAESEIRKRPRGSPFAGWAARPPLAPSG